MSSSETGAQIPTDTWVWGNERIVWGFHPSHKYTFKILEPKKGRAGCLSLQYHYEKSESWFVLRGVAWALIVVGDQICTRLLYPGDIQNIETGLLHRITGVSDDLAVLEPSTPDRHAADKSVPKDVVRLHCLQGREVAKPRSEAEKRCVDRCIEITEEALSAIDRGVLPPQYNLELLQAHGALHYR